ncbi:arabinose ABC transporter permease [Novosphingobium barchaimii LL02]|uniref:Arabinose ABC transporter permease n=1 Tax=Novosphingobium barchaimii LL02 TaxID=1114963 RepID=A0A0J7Y9A0_9SPHN|nr:MFS transporter [Novosphingobium barchaimii]KMS60182.1 arabinose ABC transporter permease [Novosphingobium barchaimii LL02]
MGIASKAGGNLEEWQRGWPIVVAAMAGFSFFSVLLSATGLFIEPLEREFGWDRATLSMGPAIATAVTALLSPFYGALIDRFGSRRLGLPGVAVTMAATCMFSFASGSQAQWVMMWIVFGFILTSIKSTIWTTAVAGTFNKGRGLALGLAVTGPAIAQTLVPPLGNFLIENFGWRSAYVWFGLGWGGVTLLLCWLFLTDAHDRKAKEAKTGAVLRPVVVLPGLYKREALRSVALWQVAVSSFVVMMMTIGLALHLFPILTEAGVPRSHAAWLLSLGGIAGIIGKLVTGVLLDRFRPNWVGSVTMGVTSVTFAVLIWWFDSMPALIIALVINGYAAGSKTQITAFLTAGYAGMRNFGMVYGVMSALVALASGLGPWIAGKVYDASGNYEPFLWAGAVACALGGALLLALPPMPQWQDDKATV